jgi:hypothetical protein
MKTKAFCMLLGIALCAVTSGTQSQQAAEGAAEGVQYRCRTMEGLGTVA